MAKKRRRQAAKSDHQQDLERRRQKQRDQARERRRAREESVRPGLQTKQLVFQVAWGTEEKPTGPKLTPTIRIDTRSWAGWIHRLGPAWARCPGLAALKKNPIPDEGLGIKEGERLLRMACDGTPAKTIERELRRAREALGPHDNVGDRMDSEEGILAYFRQLDRFFDGVEWNPPRPRVRGSGRAERPETNSRRGKPGQTDREILGALAKSGTRLQGQVLARLLGRPLGSIGKNLARLRREELIDNKLGIDGGYSILKKGHSAIR